MPKFLIALATALILSACSSIPMSSMVKLSRVDFMTTDLGRLRIAVVLPKSIEPRTNGVVMEVKYSSGGDPEKTEKAFLQPASAAADQVGLPTDIPAGTKIYVYRLSGADVVRLEGIRNQSMRDKAAKKKGSFELGISAKEFCKASSFADGPLYTTTYVATSEIGGYIILTKDLDLRGDPTIKSSLDQMPNCKPSGIE